MFKRTLAPKWGVLLVDTMGHPAMVLSGGELKTCYPRSGLFNLAAQRGLSQFAKCSIVAVFPKPRLA